MLLFHHRKTEISLTFLAILAAGASVNFLILGSAGVTPFLEYRNYILVTSIVLIFVIALYASKKNKRLANRLLKGLIIGALATLALEAVRIPSVSAQWIPHDDMIVLPGKLLIHTPSYQSFSQMISTNNVHEESSGHKKISTHSEQKHNSVQGPSQKDKQSHDMADEHSTVSDTDTQNNDAKEHTNTASQPFEEILIGGLYHFWNGATMGAVYTMVLGRGRIVYALVWGFVIHMGMMLAPWMIPMAGPFGINYGTGYTIFVASLIAHLAFGFTIGMLAKRLVKDEESLVQLIRLRDTITSKN